MITDMLDYCLREYDPYITVHGEREPRRVWRDYISYTPDGTVLGCNCPMVVYAKSEGNRKNWNVPWRDMELHNGTIYGTLTYCEVIEDVNARTIIAAADGIPWTDRHPYDTINPFLYDRLCFELFNHTFYQEA